MGRFCKSWDQSSNIFGNFAVIVFLIVQALDGMFTYIGITVWGPSIEANPFISSAVAFAGPETGLAAMKLIAAGCGILLHLRRVHTVIAFLTAFYIAVALLPWALVFLLAGH